MTQEPTIITIPPPSEFGVPHDEWRPKQYESVEWLLDNRDKTALIEAPTGSGKSTYAKAISSREKVIVLTETKSLQEQYGDIYGAAILKGRSNYPCVHPDADWDAKCDECLYSDSSMDKCPYAPDCQYLDAKHKALMARFACLNYAYWMTSMRFRNMHSGFLVCDEAHALSDLVISRSGISIGERRRDKWGLPPFPSITDMAGSMFFSKLSDPVDEAIGWLSQCSSVLGKQVRSLDHQAKSDPSLRKRAREAEYFQGHVGDVIEALSTNSQDWYIASGPRALSNEEDSEYGLGFIAKPLTAKYHFNRWFMGNWKTVAMSATLGDFDAFSEELGLTDVTTQRVPGQWTPERRPVYDLDVPRLGHKSEYKDYEAQADEIARVIKMCPKDWSGIVHVTRKKEAPLLASRLARRGLGDRVWVTPELGTEQQVAAWERRKAMYPGSLMISWCHWMGFDGRQEKIAVVAKVPFPNLGDPFESRRQKYSNKFYYQRTAWMLEQGCGRTRRGREEDYDTPDERRGLVVLADKNWTRVKRFLSESFRESIVELKSGEGL